jgi:hypothetical protein
MIILSDLETRLAIRERGLTIGAGAPRERILFARGDAPPVRVTTPTKSLEQVAFAYSLLMSSVHSDEEQDFPGGIIWLQDWNIWSEIPERVGMALFDGLRGFAGFATPIDEQLAILYDSSELVRLHSALVLILMFQWDAHYIPSAGGFFTFASHEGYVDIHPRSDAHRHALEVRLSEGGWFHE